MLAAARRRHGVEHGLRDLTKVAGVRVDERELPLDADGRPLGLRERDVMCPSCPRTDLPPSSLNGRVKAWRTCLEPTSPAKKPASAPRSSPQRRTTCSSTSPSTPTPDSGRSPRSRSARPPAPRPSSTSSTPRSPRSRSTAPVDPSAYADNRIALTGLAETNELVVEATCAYSRSGEGLHRFVDPVDERVYLYTQFEVPDARRVFTTFEQPDLKASSSST